MAIQDPIFNNFEKAIEQTDIFKKYKFVLTKKAQPSHGSGAVFSDKLAGVEIRQSLEDRSTIDTIFLKMYIDGRGTKAYTGTLPCGLKQIMSRSEVQKLLGKPDFSVEKGGIGLMAITNAADKWYDAIGNGLRIEYETDDKSIKLITIASKKAEDRFR